MDLKQLIHDSQRKLMIVGTVAIMGGSFVVGRVSVDLGVECRKGVEIKVEDSSNVEKVEVVGGENLLGEQEGDGGCKWGRVDVRGAVISPGVYCVKEGQVVGDAVTLAGGLNGESYAFKFVSQSINFAQRLNPGDKIYIPFVDDVACEKKNAALNPTNASPVVSGSFASGDTSVEVEEKNLQDVAYKNFSCVSINNSSKEELDTLSGVGQSIAQKIIDGRPYKALEDLKNVSGIGDSLFTKIREDICL